VPEPQSGEPPEKSEKPGDEEAILFCPVCSTRLESRKCKLFCSRCGYYLSCADYYWKNETHP